MAKGLKIIAEAFRVELEPKPAKAAVSEKASCYSMLNFFFPYHFKNVTMTGVAQCFELEGWVSLSQIDSHR